MFSTQQAVTIEMSERGRHNLRFTANGETHITEGLRQQLVVDHVGCNHPIHGRRCGAKCVDRFFIQQIELLEPNLVLWNPVALCICLHPTIPPNLPLLDQEPPPDNPSQSREHRVGKPEWTAAPYHTQFRSASSLRSLLSYASAILRVTDCSIMYELIRMDPLHTCSPT